MLPDCCDPNIRDKLPYTDEGPFVYNRRFSPWSDHIGANLGKSQEAWARELTEKDDFTNRELDMAINYQLGADIDLLAVCKEHAHAHRTERLRDKVVGFVHPMFMYLTNFDYDAASIHGDEYWSRLQEGFNGNLSGVSRVLFDTVHHYAATTSLFVEQGVFDRVVFTKLNTGYSLDKGHLNFLRGKDVYMAGAYNGRCLMNTCEEVEDFADNVYLIQDLIIYAPFDRDDILDPEHLLKKDTVQSLEVNPDDYEKFPPVQVVTLEELSLLIA
jgi:hypothetical protein